MTSRIGALIIVATPIGNLGDLSPRATHALASADAIACEDTRHTRKLLTHAGIEGVPLIAVHEHNEREQSRALVARAAGGQRIAVVTDAGTPGISDPGERLVAEAIAAGVNVEVVPGPSAVVAALVVSGLSTERFVFEGFLPRKGRDRRERIEVIATDDRTVVLFEAPHRLEATLADLGAACGDARRVALARELTKRFEEVWRGTLGEALAHAREVDARGEFVVVLEGAPTRPPAGDDLISEALVGELAAGATRKDAVAAVAAALEVSKRRVYEVALRDVPRAR